MHNQANKLHKSEGSHFMPSAFMEQQVATHKSAPDQNSVNLTRGRIWIPEREERKMFRVLTNGIAWVLLVLFVLLAFAVLGEVIDIVAILIERAL